MRLCTRKVAIVPLAVILAVGVLGWAVPGVFAADHGDAPLSSSDASADINDVYAFLDPNDNSQLVIILTLRGFIPAGENANFGQFDPRILSVIELETTGDATADAFLAVQFTAQTSRTAPQFATVNAVLLPSGAQFPIFTAAPTTISSTNATAPPQTVTVDPTTGIAFFAGMTDDPFNFDIPAFSRFVTSVLPPVSNPDPTVFNRGRDSFAGYNTLAIAFRIPRSLLGGLASLGVGARTFRVTGTLQTGFGSIEQLDRMGNPAINVALVPFASKNAYNLLTPDQDATSPIASQIVATLTALGTSPANIATLASVAVNNGDLLRLNLTLPNSGNGGGTGPNGFPNGRRLADDVVDIELGIITNGAVTSDGAPQNEKPFQNVFPFLALPHQPLDSGTDPTQN